MLKFHPASSDFFGIGSRYGMWLENFFTTIRKMKRVLMLSLK